jgi:5-(carboxyamino)imidazole ribonucleotide mutase
MSKILIVFGSQSDEKVYNNIINILKEENIHYEMRICSAHRTPDELSEILKTTDADVIIAGAGLAAHLPGVVASKTLKPIIGVPVSGNFEGLDALLSIMQMPPGIPVMCVGVDNAEIASVQAINMLKTYNKVHIFGDEGNAALKKAIAALKEFNVEYEINPEFESNSLNIRFVALDEKAEESNDLIIYVPLLDKYDDTAEAAINILQNSRNGLWVGLNRGENAALAAIQIMNLSHKYTEKLEGHRKKSAEKIKEHDKQARKSK